MTNLGQPATTLNPFVDASAEWIEDFLRRTCANGLSAASRSELEDQIEALVPAVVELRDGGYVNLNMRTLADFGSLDGFMQLATDPRLSVVARSRCDAMRTRMIVQGIKALSGQR